MGRPLRKQNFGNTGNAGPQLLVRANIGGEAAEDCWIVDQPGSRVYTVSSLAGGTTPLRTGRVKLQQGTITAEGQARLSVTPYDGVPNVQATADATIGEGDVSGFASLVGGSGYSVAPSVVVSGDGTGATATTTIVGGSVTVINITNGGSGYSSATFAIGAPAEGGTIEWAKTLQQHTVKTWANNQYSWVLGATASATGAATLPSA